MPGVGEDIETPDVDYNGGRNYSSWKRQAFRAITTKGAFNTEKTAPWSDNPKSAWQLALQKIDDARRQE